MQWCKKATLHFINCNEVFCQLSASHHKHGWLPPMGSFQCSLEEQLQKREDPQEQNTANIKLQVQHKYIDTAGKKVIFQVENDFLFYWPKVTSFWGLFSLGNKINKSNMPHPLHLKSTMSVNKQFSVCKLSTCFAALLNSLWYITYHKYIFQRRMRRNRRVISTHIAIQNLCSLLPEIRTFYWIIN